MNLGRDSITFRTTAYLASGRSGGLNLITVLARLAAVCAGLALLFGPATSTPAHAATFTVDNAFDATDFNPGDGVCRTGRGNPLTGCTLRAAIMEANALPGIDTVVFGLSGTPPFPGATPFTLQLAVPLPTITDRLILDATTQPGFAGRPIVELNGSVASFANPGAHGLILASQRSVVKGFVINRFDGDGIVVTSLGTGNVIQGNFIGTNVFGSAPQGNENGVHIQGSNNLVGGTAAGAGNLISGNRRAGIEILGGTLNRVQGNRIGTKASGDGAVGNLTGVLITEVGGNFTGGGGSRNVIGGLEVSARNIISGNTLAGVRIQGGKSTGNNVLGNFIGTDRSANSGPGNGFGVLIENARNNSILGGSAGLQVIARNSISGVSVSGDAGTLGNRIRQNTMFLNGGHPTFGQEGLGINLGPVGVTPNDLLDNDVGPNGLQNFPFLTSAHAFRGAITIEGVLRSTPGTTFIVDYYASAACDQPTGHGEGERYLGAAQVTTLVNDHRVTFSHTLMTGVPAGHAITATATDAAGNTSEFSRCIGLVLGPRPQR